MNSTTPEQRRFEALVGAFALLFVVVAAGFFYWRTTSTYVKPTVLFVDFAARDGLKIGADVRTAGVNAGQVIDITSYELTAAETESRHIFVRTHLALDAERAVNLPANSTFQITTEGALGEQYVEITPGTLDVPAVREGQILKGIEAFNPSKVLSLGGEVFTDLSDIVKRSTPTVEAIMEDGAAAYENVEALQERYSLLSKQFEPRLELAADHAGGVASQASEVQAALTKASEGEGLKPLGDSLSSLGAQMKGVAPHVSRDFERVAEGIGTLSETWDTTVNTAERRYLAVEEDVRSIVTGWQTLVDASSSSRRTIGAIYSDREIADDVGRATENLTGHPWRFIWPWEMPPGTK